MARRNRDGERVLNLTELYALKRAEELGELEVVDPEVEEELFMATMEEVAVANGRPNPWDEEARDNAKAALEGQSRSGVLKQQRAARKAPKPKPKVESPEGGTEKDLSGTEEADYKAPSALPPVDNTAALRQYVRDKESMQPSEVVRTDARGRVVEPTSVFFVGMSDDAVRLWVDRCHSNGCVSHTKSARIRLLAAHGMPVGRIARVLGTSYQQVYQTARYTEADSVDVPEAEACNVCRKRKH